MRKDTVWAVMAAVLVLTFSGPAFAQDKTAKAAPANSQTARAAEVAKFFALVKALDKARPITHASIKKITQTELNFYSSDHFRSPENPACSSLINVVQARGEGSVELELKPNAGLSLADVRRVFGKWHHVGDPGAMSIEPPARAYVYELPKGWLTFECAKAKGQRLLVVCLIDKVKN